MVLDDVLSDLTSAQKPKKKKRRTSSGSAANSKSKAALSKARAKARSVAEKLKASKEELKVYKEQFRKHRHKHPSDKLSNEFRSVSAKPGGKMKDELLEKLLEQFIANQAAKGCERVTRNTKQFEESRDSSLNLKMDFRQVRAANALDVFGGDEVNTKIDKLVALGYYTRKAITGKPLKLLDGMMTAAKFTYFAKEEKTTISSGSGSSTQYSFEQKLSDVPEEQALDE